MSQSSKVDNFGSFTEQISFLLTNKELDRADVLCDAALSNLKEGFQADPKSILTKFVVSFLKLFACCPNNFYEGLFKKYLSILRDLHFLKNKHGVKYQCLIPSFLQTAQSKYYSSFVSLMKVHSNQPHSNLHSQILNLRYIEGGSSLGSFLQLFKKALDKDRDSETKIQQYLLSFFNASIFTVSSMVQSWKNTKQRFDRLTYTFRLFVLGEIEKQIRFKSSGTFDRELYKMTQHYHSSTDFSPKVESLAIFLFRQVINNQVTPHISENKQIIKYDPKGYLLDSLLAYSLVIHDYSSKGKQMECWKTLILLKKGFIFKKGSQDQFADVLEVLSLELLENLSIYALENFNKRIHPFEVVRTILTNPSHLQILQNSSSLTKSALFSQLCAFQVSHPKLGLYLTCLLWKLLTFQIEDQTQISFQEQNLCSEIRKITEKGNIEKEVVQKLYFSLSLNIPFQKYCTLALTEIGHEVQSQKVSIWMVLLETITSYSQFRISEGQMRKNIDSQIATMNHINFSFQDLLDFVSTLFHQEDKQTSQIQEQTNESTFSQFSEVLIHKMNIRPLQKDKPRQQLTFNQRSGSLFVKAAQYLIISLYQKDNVLRMNFCLMKSLPQSDCPLTQKLIILTIKKYIGIMYHKLNEIFVRKLISNREYFLIWSMLISSYKVRTLFQQMSRCGIGADQLRVFLKLDRSIVKEFTEYYVSKDRYKFRLMLWQKSKTNEAYLLDSNIPDLLIGTYFQDNSKRSII